MRIILASQSPFRKHAFDILGVDYECISSDVDESLVRDDNPAELVKKLAEAKARGVGEVNKGAVVVASDFVVVYDGKIYGKPKDLEEAKKMLRDFSGNSFELINGIAVYNSEDGKLVSDVESCKVKFRELSDFEIDDYVSRYPVLKCAAAFESDGLLRFAESVEGSPVFRAGIPVNRLVEFLREFGVEV